MKLSRFKMLIIAPSLLITACGYGLKEVYNGVPYNSPNFFENYFNVWNKAINPNVEGNKISEKKDNYDLDVEKNKVFTSFYDVNFHECDNNWSNYLYTYDKVKPEDTEKKAYGPSVKLSNYDDSFRYGVTSKLFDGQMFCNGDFQNSRTQVEPTNQGAEHGFGVLFSKESNDASYFMMNFKCSVVTASSQNLSSGYSNLKVTVSFILKNNNGYTYVPVTGTVENVPTNSGDDHYLPPFSGRDNMYVCYGFSLAGLNITRLIGFTVQYEKISDTVSPKYDEQTYHAMMLYEVSFPYTTWH